ncbi:hypothetical protein D9M71_417140 [compost metagenome]
MLVTDIEGQAQQLVGAFHVFGLDDQRDAQIDCREGVELDFRRQRILGQFAIAGRCGFAGVGLAGGQVFFRGVGHGLYLDRVDAGHQRLELVQLMVGEQGRVIVPGQRCDVEERLGVGGQQR